VHLVLIDGNFVPPADRAGRVLQGWGNPGHLAARGRRMKFPRSYEATITRADFLRLLAAATDEEDFVKSTVASRATAGPCA
jgi:hypothetical protein